MPERSWKRLVLLGLAILGICGFSALLWRAWTDANIALAVMSVLLVMMSILGVAVALKGCNACVARLFGSA